MENTHSAEVVIIGAGIAGVSAALQLAKHAKVTLIDKQHIFSGSSRNNPGRMGHGFHYIDFETARMYLHASIAVQRNYPDFLIGKNLPLQHPIRRGRYYITINSIFSCAQIMRTYMQLQQEYQRLVADDPANEVFGSPEQFMKILSPEDYQDLVNAELVVGAVETAEHLFNWPEFVIYIRRIIAEHANIILLEDTEVIEIKPRHVLDSRFTIMTKTTSDGTARACNTNFIVNSTWENIDYLNETACSRYINRMRTNRLKCFLEVRLPESLVNFNSAFFCMGPFCMFANIGDGRAMLTLADVTNMACSHALRIDKDMARYLAGNVSVEEKLDIAHEILAGVGKYIPDIINAKFIDVKFGIVQTQGELNLSDLLDPSAAHHIRNYHGIREEYQGLISNPAMKLFYFVENGRQVEQFYLKQLRREQIHQEVYNILMRSHRYCWNKIFRNDNKKALYLMIDRMMLEETEDPNDVARAMSIAIENKLNFHSYISAIRSSSKIILEMFEFVDIEYKRVDDGLVSKPIEVNTPENKHANKYSIFRSHSFSSGLEKFMRPPTLYSPSLQTDYSGCKGCYLDDLFTPCTP